MIDGMKAVTRERMADALPAVGMALVVGGSVLLAGDPVERPATWAGVGLAIVVGVLLMFRRRWPVAILLALAAAVLAYNAAGFPGVGAIWPLLVALYTVAAAGRMPVAIAAAATMLAIDTTWLLAAVGLPLPTVLTFALTDAVIAGLAIALGDAVRSRRGWAAESRERLRRTREEEERESRRVVVEERMRIARELHDVTGHTLAVVGVQINVAADALPESPEEAQRSLSTARSVIDQAANDLKASVRVLRTQDDAPSANRAPLPGLADLGRLVESTRAPGMDVELVETGERAAVPAAVALTAYRIVQEALANVVRHARASAARVEVDYRADAVTLRVSDDGVGGNGPVVPGQGLAGLRERVAGLGGDLSVGPADAGGFAVSARLPVTGVGRPTPVD